MFDSIEDPPARVSAQAPRFFVQVTVRNREIGTGISEASKRVPIFDRGTGSKPERLRSESGSLQADDLSLIV